MATITDETTTAAQSKARQQLEAERERMADLLLKAEQDYQDKLAVAEQANAAESAVWAKFEAGEAEQEEWDASSLAAAKAGGQVLKAVETIARIMGRIEFLSNDEAYLASKTRRNERLIALGQSKVAVPRECLCGCKGMTSGGRFLPGHDAKLKGRLLRELEDEATRSEALASLKDLGWGKYADTKLENIATKEAKAAARAEQAEQRKAEAKAKEEKRQAEKKAADEAKKAAASKAAEMAAEKTVGAETVAELDKREVKPISKAQSAGKAKAKA